MIKILGSVMVVSSSILIGLVAKKSLKTRINTLESLIFFLEYLNSEISYSLENLPSIFKKFNSVHITSFTDEIMLEMEKNDYSFNYIWINALKNLKAKTGLIEEYDILIKLGLVIGKYSPKEQSLLIEQCSKQLEFEYNRLKKEYKNKSQIYSACSVSAGLLLVICFI